MEHNDVLSKIRGAKEGFFDVVIIDMLINNNDRNEDNCGVIKFKDSNTYKLAPIYDCGNSFYGKTSEEGIAAMLSDDTKLRSSALNGITAYEDESEKRISNLNILEQNNVDLDNAIIRVYEKVITKLGEIEDAINSIPNNFNNLQIMSDDRKRYYIETFKLRLNDILKPKCLSLTRK